jgi:hypothetical protein
MNSVKWGIVVFAYVNVIVQGVLSDEEEAKETNQASKTKKR